MTKRLWAAAGVAAIVGLVVASADPRAQPTTPTTGAEAANGRELFQDHCAIVQYLASIQMVRGH